MILYHYSVDSYKDGGELLNDFNKLRRFAEPFVFALEKGEDCFWSTFLSAMYYSRELCALGLRKRENYVKDSVEGVFEYVRRHEFGERAVSRVGCVYYCKTADEAVKYLRDDCLDSGDFTTEQVKLLEVETDGSRVFSYDQYFFNEAERVMEDERSLERVKELARRYFSGEMSENPLVEILSDGKNKVLRELEI